MIPVKILVDEEEPAKRAAWERSLKKRVEAASLILDQYCRVQLKVVATDTWESDNKIDDFFESLAEFERKVKPFPGQLAIGFTSQYQVVTGRTHMAGTRGALHTHILVREWSRQMSEPERLEPRGVPHRQRVRPDPRRPGHDIPRNQCPRRARRRCARILHTAPSAE